MPESERRAPVTHLDDGSRFDVVVCGAGSAGSVVASRLASEASLSVLLVESGGDNDRPSVTDPGRWQENFGTDAVWNFVASPNGRTDGRALYYPMGRGLGGGGSVNASVWARGHRDDWDSYAQQTGDDVWSYRSVLDVYRRIESYQGPSDDRRGIDGPMWIEQPQSVPEVFDALLAAANQAGLPRFDSTNGALMESGEGCAVRDQDIHDGMRQSPYESYVPTALESGRLTVMTGKTVRRVVIEGDRAVGVELDDGTTVRADVEVVLSLGAINTPKVLMLSGIGDRHQLEERGLEVRLHAPAVGQNLHDHALLPVVWAARPDCQLPVPGNAVTGCFWNLDQTTSGEPVVMYADCAPVVSDEAARGRVVPDRAVTFLVATRTRSRGQVTLSPTRPTDDPVIATGFFQDPTDLEDAVDAVQRALSIGHEAPLGQFLEAEVFPAAGSSRAEIARYLRSGVQTFWHQSGTARMGPADDSVVDSRLRVHGLKGLRIADASVLPHVTVANTMAPSVVIGEQAAAFMTADLGGENDRGGAA